MGVFAREVIRKLICVSGKGAADDWHGGGTETKGQKSFSAHNQGGAMPQKIKKGRMINMKMKKFLSSLTAGVMAATTVFTSALVTPVMSFIATAADADAIGTATLVGVVGANTNWEADVNATSITGDGEYTVSWNLDSASDSISFLTVQISKAGDTDNFTTDTFKDLKVSLSSVSINGEEVADAVKDDKIVDTAFYEGGNAGTTRIYLNGSWAGNHAGALDNFDTTKVENGISKISVTFTVEGTGKTTTVRGIVALFRRMGLEIVLAAPTGRAAKRMSELTGMEAQTVHRMLGMSWNDVTHQVTFQKTEKEPLEADAVIVDEMSMVDLALFSALLRALRPGTRLVLVGDADQLPSVGAGNVFSDLIRSGRVETVFLREVFRQAEQSAIIRNAHAVNLGQPPQLANNQGDFFFLCRRDGERTLSTVVELCKTRLPDHMGIPADQIQVLTPTRKGPSGTENLNRCLQAALNPPAADKREIQWGERLFRTGDRIMQTKNNYNVVWEKADGTVGTGMFNGDVGRIVEIDPSGELLVVNFDDRIATYTLDMLNEIDLAYAMTVHKAQGSEYQCVVLAAMPAAPSLMVRGVLYTALTRARELLIVVGDDAAIRAMAANDRQQRRYSGLRWRLAHFADPAER